MPQTTSRSFHSFSVEHPGFAIHPMFWTAEHLAVLNCSFQQVESDDAPESVTPDTEQAEDLTKSALLLARGVSREAKSGWVGDLLLQNKPTPITIIYASLFFDYGKHRVRLGDSKVSVYCIEEEIAIPHANPIIGYYLYNTDKEREKKLYVPPGPNGRDNDPIQRICGIRYRQVTPKDWRHDPFFVCLLIGLAQLQVRDCLVPQKGLFLARLLVTNVTDLTNAYVYKANIPHQLLDSLECPTRTIDDFVFPSIDYVVVPFEPYSTFADRIRFQLTGAEYSSPPGPCPSDQVSPSEPHGEKRKRDQE
ncbi:hypothetical protein FANTH_6412 [Fusarium anthophilum]|uniref:Uncharacterized protein n=1 Tax=Fusarium anthophilum TaxID=48485 RepID=A0A8H4ZK27_9HYPO|nr:hypothetical protein FANTH_6412 [Fusarium anthophilum]